MSEPTSSVPFRRTAIILGARVESPEGEEIGKIEEIVVHVPHGLVAYAVLSLEGLLGLGDTLFALPWSALSPRNSDEEVYVLHVRKDQLAQAPGFDRSEWPDMGDLRWCSQVDAWYRSTSTGRTAVRQA